jgi:hypothetical protein
MAKPDPAGFNGEDAVGLLGLAAPDERLVAVLLALGHAKPLAADVDELELKRVGFCLEFTSDTPPRVQQVRFELRRGWTGCKMFPGRLPWGLPSDLRTTAANTALEAHGHLRAPLSANDWCIWDVDGVVASFGFGSNGLLEVLMLERAAVGT